MTALLATTCILQLWVLSGNAAKDQNPSVTIVSPVADSFVNLNGSMYVVVKARFAYCNTGTGYVIDTLNATELSHSTTSFNYITDPNDSMGE